MGESGAGWDRIGYDRIEWDQKDRRGPNHEASFSWKPGQPCSSRLFSNHIRRSPSSGLSSPVFMSKLRGDHLNDKISRPAASKLRVVGHSLLNPPYISLYWSMPGQFI